jgi:hypothetical protein
MRADKFWAPRADKPNCSLMHSDRTMAMLKLSDRVFGLCHAYGTLHSDDQAEW